MKPLLSGKESMQKVGDYLHGSSNALVSAVSAPNIYVSITEPFKSAAVSSARAPDNNSFIFPSALGVGKIKIRM